MAETFTTESASLSDIVEDNDKNKLVLPTFQRAYVWEMSQQQSLIAAFMVEIPIGGLLTLEGKKGDFASRPLCFIESGTVPNEECSYLLDGQQRLSTLKSAFYDIFANTPGATWKQVLRKTSLCTKKSLVSKDSTRESRR